MTTVNVAFNDVEEQPTPPTSATATRLVTSSGEERKVTVTKSNKNGGRLLLDLHNGSDKIIIAKDQINDFLQAIVTMAEEGVSTTSS